MLLRPYMRFNKKIKILINVQFWLILQGLLDKLEDTALNFIVVA